MVMAYFRDGKRDSLRIFSRTLPLPSSYHHDFEFYGDNGVIVRNDNQIQVNLCAWS